MIYFIRDPSVGAIKIGHSSDPYRRIEILQTGSPTKLDLVAVIEGDAGVERTLHARFSDRRVRGEWFRDGDELADFIAQLPAATGKAKTFKTEKAELISRLRVATGAPFQTVDAWLERNSIPARYFLAIAQAGIFTLEELAERAALNRQAA